MKRRRIEAEAISIALAEETATTGAQAYESPPPRGFFNARSFSSSPEGRAI